jgi:hypothetical protein
MATGGAGHSRNPGLGITPDILWEMNIDGHVFGASVRGLANTRGAGPVQLEADHYTKDVSGSNILRANERKFFDEFNPCAEPRNRLPEVGDSNQLSIDLHQSSF